jgi:hypothetical protein
VVCRGCSSYGTRQSINVVQSQKGDQMIIQVIMTITICTAVIGLLAFLSYMSSKKVSSLIEVVQEIRDAQKKD